MRGRRCLAVRPFTRFMMADSEGRRIKGWNDQGMPVVGHEGEVRHGYLPVMQSDQLIADDAGRVGVAEGSGAVAAIEVFFQRAEDVSLVSSESLGACFDRTLGFGEFG